MSIARIQADGLLFQLEHIAAVPGLARHERYAHVDAETIAMMLEQAALFADDELAPLAASGDVAGCRLQDGRVLLPEGSADTWRSWCELGFPALALPQEHEGLDFPRSVCSAIQELGDGANLAFGMLGINLRCSAQALMRNASPELVERYLPGLVSGELASTIAISEPQAGSDVGRILTTATPQDDGSWRLSGSKIWISYGDHDATSEIIHMVLARVPNGETGTRGLGLFLVPAEKGPDGKPGNGINILRLEHKMGLHASPTCVLELDNARGELIGQPGRGLQALFVMMNGMRLAVAVQGAAVANVATLHAIRYALERPQGGHPLQPPVPIAQHADVRRMLLEMTARSELARALALRTASLLDQAELQEGEAGALSLALGELLLPVAKTLNAETGFEVASQGMQVLGGYGYTADYPLERLARDIRVAAIYEGTSGIQALDFLKRRVLADEGAMLGTLLQLAGAALQQGDSPFVAQWPALLQQMQQTLQHILGNPPAASEGGAYALLQLTGQVAACWNGHVLYSAANGDSEHETRLRAALLYFSGSLPAAAALWATRARQALPEHDFSAGQMH
jgi:alkylation response protein AidB-like acyl-CoA dehydrogenase